VDAAEEAAASDIDQRMLGPQAFPAQEKELQRADLVREAADLAFC